MKETRRLALSSRRTIERAVLRIQLRSDSMSMEKGLNMVIVQRERVF
jgi:hypothetical protein